MADYAIQLGDGASSYALATGMDNVANATKLGITLSILGDRLLNEDNSQPDAVFVVAAGYLNLFVSRIVDTIKLGIQSAAEPSTPLHYTTGIYYAGYDAARWYRVRCYWDTSQATKQSIEVYDDTDTLIDSGTADANYSISNGTYGWAELNAGGGLTTYDGGETIRWAAVWNGAPPAGAPTMPTGVESGLLRVWPCDDGGGTSISETVDNASGAMAITGSYTWVPLAGTNGLDVALPSFAGTGTVAQNTTGTGATYAAPRPAGSGVVTNRYTGTGGLSRIAPTFHGATSDTEVAVALTAGAYIRFDNNATLAATTAIHGAFCVKGDFLNALAAVAYGNIVALDHVGTANGNELKAGLAYWTNESTFAIDVGGGLYWFPPGNHSGYALGEFDDALYYDVAWHADPNDTWRGWVAVFDKDDLLGTIRAQWWYVGNMDTLTTQSTYGARFLGGHPLRTSLDGTWNWGKIGVNTTYAVENAPLEEGVGQDVSPSGHIYGTYAWVSVTAGPDHGTVTLTPSSILANGTSAASVVWYDVAENPLDPQPDTTWQVNSDSHAATIDEDTGDITGYAPGTATIRAASGATTATAELTVRPLITFAETLTVG